MFCCWQCQEKCQNQEISEGNFYFFESHTREMKMFCGWWAHRVELFCLGEKCKMFSKQFELTIISFRLMMFNLRCFMNNSYSNNQNQLLIALLNQNNNWKFSHTIYLFWWAIKKVSNMNWSHPFSQNLLEYSVNSSQLCRLLVNQQDQKSENKCQKKSIQIEKI